MDFSTLWKDALNALPRGWPLAFLLVVMAAGAYARVLHLFWPMQYDETYTYLAFARRSLFAALSDYHLPNNHIFHTLLVYISTRLLGDAPWAIRLPAFLAGWLTIPAAYVLARRHYNLTAAFLASALAALWPFLVYYSANARGYSLIGLLVLLLILLGTYLLGRPNLAGWIIFALLAALGIFTVPVMLYGFGVVCLWLALSKLRGQARAYPGRQFFYCLAAGGLLAGAAAGLLYLPAVLVSGPGAVFGNSFVRSMSLPDLWRALPEGLSALLGDWTTQMPRWLAACAGGLFVLGWLLHRRFHGPLRVPVQAAWLLWVLIMLPIQRPEPLPKLWYWLFPLAVVWAAAGLAGLLSFFNAPRRLWTAGAVGLLVATCALAVFQSRENLLYLRGAQGAEERVADFLAARVQPQDGVLVVFPTDPQVMYYCLRRGLALDEIRSAERPPGEPGLGGGRPQPRPEFGGCPGAGWEGLCVAAHSEGRVGYHDQRRGHIPVRCALTDRVNSWLRVSLQPRHPHRVYMNSIPSNFSLHLLRPLWQYLLTLQTVL